MMKYSSAILSVLLLTATVSHLVACTNFDDTNDNEMREILFDISVNRGNVTRGTACNDMEALQDYTILVTAKKHSDNTEIYFQNEQLAYSGGEWRANKYFWVPDLYLDFFARAPHNAPNITNETGNVFDVTIPSDLTAQRDILCSKTSNKYREIVPLELNHILSQVNFTATVIENWVVTIYSIKINNIYNKGTYDYDTGFWTLPTDGVNDNDFLYTLASPVSITGPETTPTNLVAADNQVLMLLPQTLTGWNKETTTIDQANTSGSYQCYLDIECRIWDNYIGNYLVGASGSGHIYVPFSDTWLVGKNYVYNLAFGSGFKPTGDPTIQLIELSSTITDWTNNISKNGWAVYD